MAIPFVLNGGRPSTAEIEALGLKHTITVATDHITRRPDIDHQVSEFVKKPGTTIRLQVDSACSHEECGDRRFLQDDDESDEGESGEQQCLQALIKDYSLFNPHTTFVLLENGTARRFEATALDWKKWLPTDATSAHWYSPERFEDLVASYVAAERTGAEPKTVRGFISEFRGLSGTAKQKRVSAEAGLERAYLHDLIAKKGQLDKAALGRLLETMQSNSTPVKPEALGILGEPHFRARLTGPESEKTFRYKRLSGTDDQNLPFVVEVAFSLTDDPCLRGTHIGLNWAGALGNPLQDGYFAISNDDGAYGFSALLEKSRINMSRDPVCLVVHLICPRFNFLDRGKGSVAL